MDAHTMDLVAPAIDGLDEPPQPDDEWREAHHSYIDTVMVCSLLT